MSILKKLDFDISILWQYMTNELHLLGEYDHTERNINKVGKFILNNKASNFFQLYSYFLKIVQIFTKMESETSLNT